MRPLVLCLMLLTACWSTPDAPSADPLERAASLPDIEPQERHGAREASTLKDFAPPTLLGAPATTHTATEDRVEVSYAPEGRAIRLAITRIADVAATRARYELLGKDVSAHMDGAELKGLRYQGNPAQLRRELSGEGVGTLTVVATNTYLVELYLTPTRSTDELLALADRVDIGSMTLYAIKKFKEERAESTSSTPPTE